LAQGFGAHCLGGLAAVRNRPALLARGMLCLMLVIAAAWQLRGAARQHFLSTCVVDSNSTCLVDSGCPGGGQNMTCTRPMWWTTPAPVIPTEPPQYVNVTMQADCSYMPTEHFAEPGVQLPKTPPVDNSSGMVAKLMPASPALLQRLRGLQPGNISATTYPCNVTKLVRMPPVPPPASTPPPPLVPGRCFCKRGCWNPDLQRCLIWKDMPAIDINNRLDSYPLEALHSAWNPWPKAR